MGGRRCPALVVLINSPDSNDRYDINCRETLHQRDSNCSAQRLRVRCLSRIKRLKDFSCRCAIESATPAVVALAIQVIKMFAEREKSQQSRGQTTEWVAARLHERRD